MAVKRNKDAVDVRIGRLAEGQGGTVEHSQLAALGLSRQAIHDRVRSGRLYQRYRGVYAVGHPVLALAGELHAALLAHGPGAVLSHRTAASHWGLRPGGISRIDVLVTGGGRRRREGIRLHRTRFLPDSERTLHEGLAVTTWPRTVLDLAAVLQPNDVRVMLDRAMYMRIFDLVALRAVLEAHPSRAGRARLAKALDRYTPTNLTRGRLERELLAFCGRHRLPRPLVNQPISLSGHETATVDFCWPGPRVGVETDDLHSHLTPTAFENDRRRDAILTAAGWTILRYTRRRLRSEPAAVAAELRALLERPAR